MQFLAVLLIATSVLVLFTLCLSYTQSIEEKAIGFVAQPEISDSEFCDLLPEVDPTVALRVRQICSDVSGWDRDEIHPYTRLIEFEL